MTIHLTGSSGFVGLNLKPFLEKKGLSVSALNLRGEWQKEVFETNDCIIHLAGKAHDLKNTSVSADYYNINYELTKELYDKFLISASDRFIFISSVKASADSIDEILTEQHSPDPKTHYGKSKLMAEQYIEAQPLPAGKSYYILRPCMIHGPGNKGNLNLLYKFIQKGIPYPLAAFENRRSYLSIDNLCFLISELINQKDVPVGIYHVADDYALSTNEVVSILADSMDKKARLWHISSGLIFWMARIGDKLGLPLNSERLKKLTENYVVSNTKIISALNSKLPLSSVEGLKLTAKSFKI
ncbi:nucleoside-diphosphate-sugar epimerase [Pedobacter cryoconitis]|uniref:Nucleoside-diphosphate-sugar epimerase n=1 Tax=Pedobacter cryoconitis TaxID=188932 RepID=A0A7W8ZM62_9SPHI|nr:NAD-dependent epimerase/dehydratase family protein [Pedobacter cryoconitis]MBB5636586.1 nucleoside-diphosphate-sugar epimerase [Pedobacter cryoconitis]